MFSQKTVWSSARRRRVIRALGGREGGKAEGR